MKSELSSLSPLPPIVPNHLTEEALKEVNSMADKLVEAFETEPKEVVSESNELESTKDALSLVVKSNESELTGVKKDLKESSLDLVGGNAANIGGTQIDEVLEADQELLEKITQTASEIADNFKSDPVAAKTAFDKLQEIYKRDAKPSAEAIDAIPEGKDDTALQMLKNSLKEISVSEASEVSDERKAQISQALLTKFSFLGDAKERDETQAATQFLTSWAGLENDGALNLTDQEKDTIDKGFESALIAPDEVSPTVELKTEFNDQMEEVEAQQSTVEKNKVKILQTVEEQEEEEEEEEKTEIPQLASEEKGEKKEEVEELKEREVEELEEKEEEEKEKKKKSATRVTEQSSVDLPEDEKPKKGISSKDLEDFAKASFKPAIRIGLALACAFLLPGVGPVVALGCLAVTSSEDEKKADLKKPFKANENSEAEEYLKEREKLRTENFSKGGGVKTKVGEIAAGVVSEEGKELKKTQEELLVDKDALKGVDNLPKISEQEVAVDGETKQQSPKTQEGEDAQAAIKSAVQAILNADGDVVEREGVVAPTMPASQVDKKVHTV